MKRVMFAVGGLAASGLVLVSFVGPVAPANAVVCSAADDWTPPTFGSSSVSPSSVEIGSVKRKLTVTVRASDDCGIKAIDVVLTPRTVPADGVTAVWFKNLTRVSGTATDGTWSVTQTLWPYLHGGVWDVTQLNIDDLAGNETTKVGRPGGTTHVRHSTKTKLHKPRSKVDKGKRVTISGKLVIAGAFHRSQADVQSRVPGHTWQTLGTVMTGKYGNFSAKYMVTKTKDYRVVHHEGNTTTASTSKTFRVQKK